MNAQPPHKRSLRIDGHPTSVALEPAFWAVLEAAAAQRGVSMPRLIGDMKRALPQDVSLASGLRCEALKFAQQRQRAA